MNNLDVPQTSFVGREGELGDVRGLLRLHRLVTLVGAGGCGKTRLSIECALAMLAEFSSGVWFVDLAVIADGDLVLPTTVRTAFPDEEDLSLQSLVGRLGGGEALLIIDNCEHVLEAVREMVVALLSATPKVHVLATSRHSLGVTGEIRYRVPSLSIPPHGVMALEDVVSFEAPRLFIERALALQPDRGFADEEAPALASICQSLGGIPLAIELAAAQSVGMALGEMTASVSAMFRLLSVGRSGLLPRQQTLRALIDWSYNLLSVDEKRMLRRIAVFAGSASGHACTQLCSIAGESGPISEDEVTVLLDALVEKSMLRHTASDRYSMLPTVRHYALERLADAGDEEAYRRAHCELCVMLATGVSNQRSPVDRLSEVEQDDFRAALGWGMAHGRQTDAALLLAGELGILWYQRGYGVESRQWLHRALMQVENPRSPQARLIALKAAVGISGFEGDHTTAKRFCDELETLSREQHDTFYLAVALNEQGKMAQYDRGDTSQAKAYFEESLMLFRTLPDCAREANSIGLSLGLLASAMGCYDEAVTYLQECVEFARLADDGETFGYGLANLAGTLADACRYEEALAAYDTAFEFAQKRGLRTLEVNLWVLSSRMALDRGLLEVGKAGYARAHELSISTQDRHREQLTGIGLARAFAELGELTRSKMELRRCWVDSAIEDDDQLWVDILFAGALVAFGEGRFQLAANFLGSTMAVREGIAWVIPPAEQLRWSQLRTKLQARLGEDLLEASVLNGRLLPPDSLEDLLFSFQDSAGP